jgi:hypothetical protein
VPRVTVEISDEALRIVRSALTVRWLAQTGATAVETLAARIVEALDERQEVVTISTAAERAAQALGKTNFDTPTT